MDFFSVFKEFFVAGNACKVVVVSAGITLYVFAVTFLSCLCDVTLRRGKKGFFIYLSALSLTLITCACVAEATLRRGNIANAVLTPFLFATLFFVCYGILWVESKIKVSPTKKERAAAERMILEAVRQAESFSAPFYESGQKPAKKAVICEVPLRKTQRLTMNCVDENGLCTDYIKECIDRLKGKALSKEDEEELAATERELSLPLYCQTAKERGEMTDRCEKIINLMSKYF